MYCPRCGSKMRELSSFNLTAKTAVGFLTTGPIREYQCPDEACGNEEVRHYVFFNGIATSIYVFKKILRLIGG